MSDNELKLLHIIRKSQDPTTALITAISVITEFLKEGVYEKGHRFDWPEIWSPDSD